MQELIDGYSLTGTIVLIALVAIAVVGMFTGGKRKK